MTRRSAARRSSIRCTAGLAWLGSVAAVLGFATPTLRADITVDVGRGPVVVHVPNSYDPAVPAPLIVLLHGYSSSGDALKSYVDLSALSEQYGFLYTAPDGTFDSFGLRFWNATDACCDFFGSNVDDSGYLEDLVDEIKVQLTVAERRVHFFGHSNGGFMSYRMACDHSDWVASITSLAGATFFDPNDCAPFDPVHVLQIHGTNDSVILYGGGNIGGIPYPGAVDSAKTWRDYDGCTKKRDDSSPNLDLDASIAGDETEVTRWVTDCDPGGSAELWTIVGGEHSPVPSADFAPLVVDYFIRHPKPGQWTDFGHALAGIYGDPVLDADGSLAAGDVVTLMASNVLENTPAFLVIGFDTWYLPFAGGTLVPSIDVVFNGLRTNAAGELTLSATWPDGIPPLFETYYQAWFLDPAGPQLFSATNALQSITP